MLKNNIYFDYAATTPVDSEVVKTMAPYFSQKFGNPSSFHSFGQIAITAVDEAREKIAGIIGADFREIIFTGSATEANNLALRGVVKAACQKTAKSSPNITRRIIISAIEHDSILKTAYDLEKEGIEIIYLPVDKQGLVDLKKLKNSLNEQTILISIMYANNEIGTIQPISEIAKIIKEFRAMSSPRRRGSRTTTLDSRFRGNDTTIDSRPVAEQSRYGVNFRGNDRTLDSRPVAEQARYGVNFRGNNKLEYPLFHTDAVQAIQFLDCDVNKLGVDLMTLSAHKIYGPKGTGLLYCKTKNDQYIAPIITGGGQEFNLRSGTENIPAIVGFAKAIELAQKNRQKEFKRIFELTNYFWQKLKKINPKIEINGLDSRPVAEQARYGVNFRGNDNPNHLPNILNIYFPKKNAEELLTNLDLNGIAASSGSACSARAAKLSHVLRAIGLPEQKIKNSIRFSFGKFTTKKEIIKSLTETAVKPST